MAITATVAITPILTFISATKQNKDKLRDKKYFCLVPGHNILMDILSIHSFNFIPISILGIFLNLLIRKTKQILQVFRISKTPRFITNYIL